jgi:hypothetical protein
MESYEIIVRGQLDARWAQRLQGLTITPLPDGTTRLRGGLADQAALHGVLASIRDLSLPLLLVQRHEPADSADTDEVSP